MYKKKSMDNVSSMSSRVSGNLHGATLYIGVYKKKPMDNVYGRVYRNLQGAPFLGSKKIHE